MEKRLPISCPSCGEALHVTRFICKGCGTVVEGEFALPLLMRLTPDEGALLLNLLLSGANLKVLAKNYRVSYPTVRNRVDALRIRVEALQGQMSEPSKEEQA